MISSHSLNFQQRDDNDTDSKLSTEDSSSKTVPYDYFDYRNDNDNNFLTVKESRKHHGYMKEKDYSFPVGKEEEDYSGYMKEKEYELSQPEYKDYSGYIKDKDFELKLENQRKKIRNGKKKNLNQKII